MPCASTGNCFRGASSSPEIRAAEAPQGARGFASSKDA